MKSRSHSVRFCLKHFFPLVVFSPLLRLKNVAPGDFFLSWGTKFTWHEMRGIRVNVELNGVNGELLGIFAEGFSVLEAA